MSDYEKLAEELLTWVKKYVVLADEDSYTAVVLWIFHTHVIEVFESTPRLAIVSPEKQCGKTRLLECLELVCKDARMTTNISSAALFRLIHSVQPTLLMDEVDAIFGTKAASEHHEDLRALLNSGYRKNNLIYRCENFGRDVSGYETYAAVALASIGTPPDTVMDRSVPLHLRRRAEGEYVTPFRRAVAKAEADLLLTRLAEWASESVESVGEAPELPEGLVDRPADVWEPLIAVADSVGGEWGKKARDAAIHIVNRQRSGDGSLGVQILMGIKQCFAANPTVKDADGNDKYIIHNGGVHSRHLVIYLNGIDGNKWAKWNNGMGIGTNDLGRYLAPYGIESKSVRVHDAVAKGYKLDDFTDSFSRYVRDALNESESETLKVADNMWS